MFRRGKLIIIIVSSSYHLTTELVLPTFTLARPSSRIRVLVVLLRGCLGGVWLRMYRYV